MKIRIVVYQSSANELWYWKMEIREAGADARTEPRTIAVAFNGHDSMEKAKCEAKEVVRLTAYADVLIKV
jgi:hypothetical protein